MRFRTSSLTTFVVFVLLAALHCRAADGAVSSRVVNQEGKTLAVLKNTFVELTVDPARGGACVDFRFLDNGEQIVSQQHTGMFLDHWARFPYPSGLMHLPYQYELLGDGKNEVGIRLWVKVPEKGGGQGDSNKGISLNIPTSPDLVGLTVAKTIFLGADSDLIRVTEEVHNTTKESRSAALQIQHHFDLGGERFTNIWYLPTERGIEYQIQPADETGRPIGVDWVSNPTGGWMAVRSGKTDRGLMFAFDYNYLQKTYTSGSTAEWFLDSVPLAPGKSFKTEYVIKPVKGFKDFVYASRRLVSNIQADETGDNIAVRHDIAAVSDKLEHLDLELTLTEWKSKTIVARETKRIERLGLERQHQEFRLKSRVPSDGLVLKIRVRGSDFEEKYDYFYSGDKDEYERRYNPFATKGMALPGAKGDAYAVKQPRKIRNLDKPDFSSIARPGSRDFKTLVVFGLYTHMLNIDDALAGWKYKDKTPAQIIWANCPPNAVEGFPGSYDDLFSYNTIVLSDVNYKAIGDIGFEMICDYVRHGGNLLIIGGPYAYGNGEFEDTSFLEVLPVFLTGPFDLKWAGKDKSWDLEPVKRNDPMLQGISFAQKPKVFWCHFVTPKDGREVLLRAGNQSVLIRGRYGQGKVVAITLSPTGNPVEGETAWWDWDGWFPLVRNAFTWLNE